MESGNFEVRRRAVRVAPSSDIEITVKKRGQILHHAKILDISTLGLGLELDHDPGDENLQIQFLSPEILAGLEITGKIRNKREDLTDPHQKKILLGLEFVFRSNDQQSLLLRWFTNYLKEQTAGEFNLSSQKEEFQTPPSPYGPSTFELAIRLPKNADELTQCFYLLQPLQIHHALLQTKFFLGIHEGTVASVLPLILDTLPFKLPSDHYFPDYLEKLRKEQRSIGEIQIPKFNEDSPLLKAHPAVILRKLHLLFSIFMHIVIYAKYFARLTDLLVLVPPQLQEFYRLWLFKDLRDHVNLEVLKKDGAVNGYKAMHLDLVTLEENLGLKRPELLEQLRELKQSPAFVVHFQESFFPDKPFLDKWFFKKSKLIGQLTEEQKAYFQLLVPDITFA